MLRNKSIGLVILSIIGVLAVGGFGAWTGGILASSGVKSSEESNTEELVVPYTTTICGLFTSPQAVLGLPIGFGDGYIKFDDGYVLMLKEVPSMYIGKPGYFVFGSEGLKDYALVKQSFDPCPSSK